MLRMTHGDMSIRKCKVCDNNWVVTSQNKTKKYCSRKCQHVGITTYLSEDIVCAYDGCNVKFTVKSNSTQKYCSHKCAMSDSTNWIKTRKQTNLDRYNDVNFNNSTKRKQTNINKYGVDNVSKVGDIVDKAKSTRLRLYGCEFILGSVYFKNNMVKQFGNIHQSHSVEWYDITIRKTHEDLGLWVTRSNRTDWSRYKQNVKRITQRNWLLHGYEYNKGLYDDHLDHKYSIYNGFKYNVPVEVIGSIVNLQILSARENQTKRESNSITLEQLVTEYNQLISKIT